MKIRYIALALILFIPVLSPAAETPLIITSTEDLASIASAIGGDVVRVEFLAPGKANTHVIEVKPSIPFGWYRTYKNSIIS